MLPPAAIVSVPPAQQIEARHGRGKRLPGRRLMALTDSTALEKLARSKRFRIDAADLSAICRSSPLLARRDISL
jgi:hypothetical protein